MVATTSRHHQSGNPRHNEREPMKNTLYALVVLCATSAFGWTCNVPGQIRVQVPTGTVGSGVGDGSGQVVVDNGLTFECETLPTASGTAVNTNTNTATSASNSNSSATGGNATSNQTQGQKQRQSQSSNNNNQSAGGSVSNVGNSVTNVAAPEIPVNSAFAPPVFSSANCFKGWSAGAQTPLLGGSLGGGGIDKDCVAEREAVDYLASGSRVAFCKMKVTTKESKAAGITFEDCMNVPIHVQPAPQPTPVSVQPPIVVTSPAPQIIVIEPPITVVPAPAPHKAVVQHKSQRCPVTPLQNECPVVRGEK
jgi:hypothetical protein